MVIPSVTMADALSEGIIKQFPENFLVRQGSGTGQPICGRETGDTGAAAVGALVAPARRYAPNCRKW